MRPPLKIIIISLFLLKKIPSSQFTLKKLTPFAIILLLLFILAEVFATMSSNLRNGLSSHGELFKIPKDKDSTNIGKDSNKDEVTNDTAHASIDNHEQYPQNSNNVDKLTVLGNNKTKQNKNSEESHKRKYAMQLIHKGDSILLIRPISDRTLNLACSLYYKASQIEPSTLTISIKKLIHIKNKKPNRYQIIFDKKIKYLNAGMQSE